MIGYLNKKAIREVGADLKRSLAYCACFVTLAISSVLRRSSLPADGFT